MLTELAVRPWSLKLSCENLAWFAVAVGVILRVWEYLEFRSLYMDEVSLLKNLVGRGGLRFPARARRRPDGPAGLPGDRAADGSTAPRPSRPPVDSFRFSAGSRRSS